MRQIKMIEMQEVILDSIHHCKYCGRELPNEIDRAEVLNVNTNKILYVYCQTDHCMSAHIADFYQVKNTHVCYSNACMEFVK